MKKSRVGEVYKSNCGSEFEIIETFTYGMCTIRFLKGGNIKTNVNYRNILKGSVKDNLHPSVLGIGYIGEGIFKTKISNTNKENNNYMCWKNMLYRCYGESQKDYNPTYKDCTVAEEWHNFQNFAEWFEQNYNRDTMKGWHLDKDILVKGNKIYSPETCCFVPDEINKLFLRNTCAKTIRISNNKFITSIRISGKNHHLGSFSTQDEVFNALNSAKKKYISILVNKYKTALSEQVIKCLLNSELNKDKYIQYIDDLIISAFNEGLKSSKNLETNPLKLAYILGVFKSRLENDNLNENILNTIKTCIGQK